MTKPSKRDIELIDFLLVHFYNNGEYGYIKREEMYDLVKDEIHKWDADRLRHKMMRMGLIELVNKADYPTSFKMAANGIEVMNVHKSYANYLAYLDAEEKRKRTPERFDRRIKNIGIMATLAVSVATLVLTQCPKPKDPQQGRIEGGLQSVETKLDSLSLLLKKSQAEKEKSTKEPIATDK
jgi:hypothetical protein